MAQTSQVLQEAVHRESRGIFAGAMRVFLKSPSAMLGLSIVVIVALVAIAAPWISPYDPIDQIILERLEPPSVVHWFGTDKYGRDVLSRVIWGARISLQVGVTAVVLGVAVGIFFGSIAGYFGGKIDQAVVMVADIMLSFPGMLLALGLAVALGSGLNTIIIAVAVWSIPSCARLLRGQSLTVKSMDYVQAAVVLGAGHFRIMMRHILPNVIMPVIVYATLRVAGSILVEATLSFLGVGVKPPTPTWGNIISDGRQFMRDAPWISLFPGLVIMLTVTGFNLMGDALRDAFDPRLRGES